MQFKAIDKNFSLINLLLILLKKIWRGISFNIIAMEFE